MIERAMTTAKISSPLRLDASAGSREKSVLERVKRSTAAATRPTISHQTLFFGASSRSIVSSPADIEHKRTQKKAKGKSKKVKGSRGPESEAGSQKKRRAEENAK